MSDLDLTNRELYQYWTKDVVRFADLDTLNHLNNAASAIYCEAGRVGLFADVLDHDFSNRKFNFVIANINISFLKQVDYPNDILIGTCITRLGNSSIGIGQGLFVEDYCFTTAEATIVWIDMDSGKGAALTDQMRAKLEMYMPATKRRVN